MSPEQADSQVRSSTQHRRIFPRSRSLCAADRLMPFAAKRHDDLRSMSSCAVCARKKRRARVASECGSRQLSRERPGARRGARELIKLLRGDLDWITMKALDRTATDAMARLPISPRFAPLLDHEPWWRGRRARRIKSANLCVATVRAGFIGMVIILSPLPREPRWLLSASNMRRNSRRRRRWNRSRGCLLRRPPSASRMGLKRRTGIILEVLTNPKFKAARTSAAISVYQDMRAADVQLEVLSGHTDILENAEFSPDAPHRHASMDRSARVWDARSGVQIGRYLETAAFIALLLARWNAHRHFVDDKTARIWMRARVRKSPCSRVTGKSRFRRLFFRRCAHRHRVD